MKRLILIFIFISGINLFGQTFFYLRIYKGEANYLKGYNQYLPDNYYIFNYQLNIVGNKYQYDYEKEYIYNYTNKKMYLLKDYYSHEYEDLKHYGEGLSDRFSRILNRKIKYYDLNAKQMQTNYKFAYITISEPNRFGEITTNKYHGNSLFYSVFNFYNYPYLNKVYKNSLKQPSIIDTKNIGLYIYSYFDYSFEENKIEVEYILTLGSEYHDFYSIRDNNYYEYSSKDYIFRTNGDNYSREDTNYYIIDLETKSKININYENTINKEEYKKELNKETKEMKSQISEKEKNIDKLKPELSNNMQNSEIWENQKDCCIKNKITVYTKKPYKKKKDEATAMATAEWEEKASSYQDNIDNLKKEIEKLENEIKELEKSIEEFENIYKNKKNRELENK